MNKKGQSLVLFVILLPIMLIILSGIIELSIVGYEKISLESVTKTILKNSIDSNSKDDIIELYRINGVEYDDLIINYDNGLTIEINKTVDSFMGKIINKSNYKISVKLSALKENDEIVVKKG